MYRPPSLFAGVTFQECPANTKTANNEGPQFWRFYLFKMIKSTNNQGKCPRITKFVHNSQPTDNQNRKNKPADNEGHLCMLHNWHAAFKLIAHVALSYISQHFFYSNIGLQSLVSIGLVLSPSTVGHLCLSIRMHGC